MNDRERSYLRMLRAEARRELCERAIHALLIDAGARLCPKCQRYVFNRDVSIEYRCLAQRAVPPPCEECAR